MTPLEIGEISGSLSQKPPLWPFLQPKPYHANPTQEVVNVKVVNVKCSQADKKILICIESPWKTLKVILLQEGSVMGHLQTAYGGFFISDLRL